MVVHTTGELAAIVKEQRGRLGWTQTELAQRAGVNRRWVSEFEADKPTAQIGQVLKVLNALQINLSLDTEIAQADQDTKAVDLNELMN